MTPRGLPAARADRWPCLLPGWTGRPSNFDQGPERETTPRGKGAQEGHHNRDRRIAPQSSRLDKDGSLGAPRAPPHAAPLCRGVQVDHAKGRMHHVLSNIMQQWLAFHGRFGWGSELSSGNTALGLSVCSLQGRWAPPGFSSWRAPHPGMWTVCLLLPSQACPQEQLKGSRLRTEDEDHLRLYYFHLEITASVLSTYWPSVNLRVGRLSQGWSKQPEGLVLLQPRWLRGKESRMVRQPHGAVRTRSLHSSA